MIKIIKKLIDKYKKHKEYFSDLSPKGKWLYCRNIGILILKLSGLPVLDPDWSPNWYSFVPGFLCSNIFISFFYTIWYYIDKPITGILATPMFGVVIPVRICDLTPTNFQNSKKISLKVSTSVSIYRIDSERNFSDPQFLAQHFVKKKLHLSLLSQLK